jgi:hypothetical protein
MIYRKPSLPDCNLLFIMPGILGGKRDLAPDLAFLHPFVIHAIKGGKRLGALALLF